MENHPYGARVVIDLDAIAANLALIRAQIPANCSICAVVKDLCYGLGSLPVVTLLEEQGVSMVAVARASEASYLRENGIALPILILGRATPAEMSWGASNNVRFALAAFSDLAVFAQSSIPLVCHILVDTGMHRMGILPSQMQTVACTLAASPHITVEGVYTHLASADAPDAPSVKIQQTLFAQAQAALHEQNIHPSQVHYANSAASLHHLNVPCTMIRPGIMLYGCNSDPERSAPINLRTVIQLSAPIVRIEEVPAGTAIGYAGRYITSAATQIATVPIGYAHGYPRALTNKGSMLIHGKRYPIAGTVTMDYTMLDIGIQDDQHEGDEAIAIGTSEKDTISVDEIARQAGTIGYEILCGISPTLPHAYLRNGTITSSRPASLW